MQFIIRFDFDSQGEAPKVEVYDTRFGHSIMEVYEEPTCSGPWSRDPNKWTAGPMALVVVHLLNSDGVTDGKA